MKKAYISPVTLHVSIVKNCIICTSLAVDNTKTVEQALGRDNGDYWDEDDMQ